MMYGTTLTGYRARLNQIYNDAARNDRFEETMTEWMQADYPGNYKVQEAYIPDRYCCGAKMVFESEQDELWFKLRYE